VAPGSVCDATVCLGDFLATCADIVGQTLDHDEAEDSFSLLPLLHSDGSVFERAAVIHHSLAGMYSVRQGRWKLVLGLGSGGFSEPRFGYSAMSDAPKGQLYDMVTDWREQHNLWNERPDVVARLAQLVADYRVTGRSAPPRCRGVGCP
jgi:arylsulfatase A-like enzyme